MAAWYALESTDVLGALWFLGAWLGYAVIAHFRAKQADCITSVLHVYRYHWMLSLLTRDNRITDASLLSSLERNASFLASTAMLIIAGLVTALASVDKMHETLSALPFSHHYQTPSQLQFKVMLMILVFVYSFFTFTWAMRQYGFCAILFGSAPCWKTLDANAEAFAKSSAVVIDQAGASYNVGLRAYYFSIPLLAWIFNVWLFVGAVALVVIILYLREFHSPALKAMASSVHHNLIFPNQTNI